MKTIGLLGGMNWEATIPYYRLINQGINHHLGGLHSGKIILHSIDFYELEVYQASELWSKAGKILADATESLEKAGADGIMLCSNTMHKVVSHVEEHTSLPVLHIADATGQAIRNAGLQQVALLGTRYTMEQDFYRQRLKDYFGITSLIPDENQRIKINQFIFDDVSHGIIHPESTQYYKDIINELKELGAEGVILGCSQIARTLTQNDYSLPAFDSMAIHAQAAVDFMLSDQD